MKQLKMKTILLSVLITCVTSLPVFAQKTYIPDAANLQNRQWFVNTRMGLFIHFGIYSNLDDPDEAWAMRKYSVPQYEKMADDFDPEYFDAKNGFPRRKS